VKAAVLEEILFRGVLFRLLEQRLGAWLALAISAAIFGGLHLTNANATLTGAVAVMLTGGMVLGAAFMLTRRLWLPIGIHFAVNFVQSGIFGSAVSGNQAGHGLLRGVLTGPDWLTGGTFGVEASLVTALIGLVAGGLLLWLAHRKGNITRPYWSRSDNAQAEDVSLQARHRREEQPK
jgi:membrane protease YdiL (CAAX protease family)